MKPQRVLFVPSVLWMLAIASAASAQTQPGEQWEWRNPLPQGNSLLGVTWGGGQFVAVGESGTVLTSSNGGNWRLRTSGTTSRLRNVAWSGSLFVIVGDNGVVVTSPDGITWTPQTSGTTSALWGATWGASLFAVVGDSGVICTSPDGIAWSAQTSGTTSRLRDVIWSGSQFVAVGDNGVIRTSPDGITWTAQASGTTSALMSVIWSGTQYMTVGGSGVIRTSPDGITWTTQSAGTTSTLYGVAWSGTRFVIVNSTGFSFTSPDGVSWTTQPGVSTSTLSDITWGGDQFAAVGFYGTLFTSPDGASWTARLSGETQNLVGVTWSGSQFVAVGELSTILTSPDGVDWTKRTFPDNYSSLSKVTWGKDKFVVVGYSIYGSVLATSPDGATWTRRGAGLSSFDMLNGVTWADNQFVAVGDNSQSSASSPIVTSTNGVNWTKRVSGTIQALNGVAGSGDLFVAVGAGSTVLTSPNGTDWTVHSVWQVYNGSLLGVAWGHNQFVAVGGAILTSPDGTTWTKQVSGTSLSSVTWNGLQFVAVGSGGAILTSPDGVNWTARSSGCVRNLSSVTWNGSQFVVVGDNGTILGSGTSGTIAGRILSPLLSGTLVAGDSLRFSALPLNSPQATYHWDFGDGRSASVPNPGLVRYSSTGAFQVVYSAAVGGEAPDSDARSYTVVADTGGIADLQVTGVSLAETLAVGQPVQITYTARNTGQGPAGFAWRDALYLSRDALLDTTDLLLGSVAVNQNLSVGQSYQNVINATLPAAYAGGCHLILAVNERWEILELHRLNNEHATQITALVPMLVAGTNTSASYAAGRVEHYFRMTATAGQNLLLNVAGVPPDLEVFVRSGGLPTAGGDYAYRVRGGEQLLVPAATAGDWFIMVRGAVNQAGAYTLGFSREDLVLSGSSPAKHETGTALELTLTGAGFIRPLAVKLVSNQGPVYVADQVEVDSFSQATASFAAGTVPTGLYTVRIERNEQVAELPGALEIATGGQAKLKTNLILPGTFGYHGLATVYVEYANIGDAPMPAPVLVVTAAQNGRAGAILTLEQSRLKSGFWTSVMPAGFANAVQFIASGESPGILQAGESGRVPVYYAGWQQPWDWNYPPFEWHVGVLDADNATPVDWSSLKAGMRPDYVRADAWDVVWDNFTALAGDTWGDYVAMLTRNAQYLHRHGVQVRDLESLVAFSMRLADGISPIGRLAGAADEAVRAPGLPIFFGRSFLQPISRRFELGDLGRGWTHNWRQSMQARQDGTVVISDMTGTPRIFNPDSRYTGRYLAQPGDQGHLRAAGEGFHLTEADGGVLFYRSGKLEYVEDSNGNRITCQYAGGRLTRLSHSAGGCLDLSYNSDGYIASVADPQGRQTTYSYSGEHLTSVCAHDGRTTTYAYVTTGAAQHALAQIALANGNTRSYSYDARGRLTGAWRNEGEERLTFTLGDNGRIVVTDALGNASSLFFDHWARLIKTENPLGETVQMRFDELGRLLSVRHPEGSSASYAYDQRGNLAGMTDYLRHTTRFVHTREFNRLSRITDALGRQTRYAYDDRGNLTSVVYPDGSSEGWAHDGQGKPTAWTNRRGKVVAFQHDAAGRITRKGYADGSSAVYRYDASGKLKEAEDGLGVTCFTYNQLEYLTGVAYPSNRWLAFTYDAVGRRTASEDHTGHRIEYHYDASSRLSRISAASGDIVTYTFDALGRLARKTLGNGVYADYTYDPAGRLLSLVNHLPGGEVLSRFAYTYDRRGRRTAMQTHYGEWAYAYDEAGQLTRAVLTSTNAAIPNQDLTYEYDALGNRVRTRVNGIEEEYHANHLNQYTTVGDRTYAYDLDGNLVEETGPAGTTAYTYNDENRLIGVARGTNEWHYTYDALGNRVASTVDEVITRFVVDPAGLGDVVGEYDSEGKLVAGYEHGFGLLSHNDPDGISQYYTFDALGNVSELTGNAGDIRNAYAYDPFGQTLHSLASIPNPFGFVGEWGVMAEGNGLNYMRARFYATGIGRFAAVDPSGLNGGDVNFYRYAANAVTTWTDPTGESIAHSICETGSTIVKLAGDYADLAVWTLGSALTVGGTLIAAVAPSPAWKAWGIQLQVAGPGIIAGYSKYQEKVDFSGKFADWLSESRYCAPNKKPVSPPDLLAAKWSIVSSYFVAPSDPNAKAGVAGFGEEHFVQAGRQLSYRIGFENYALATAPAQVVTIRDPLSPHLDWSTLELGEIGFGSVSIQAPPGLQHYETLVDYAYTDDDYDFLLEVHVEAWLENGTLCVNFSSIDPTTGLPPPVDIGFLMPETNPATGRGQGYVTYLIRPKANLPSGTAIRNVATIQFDFGEKIDTNQVDPHDPSKGTDPDREALVTIDADPPTSTVAPLPAEAGPMFLVQWSGHDAPGGSGLQSYDVYVTGNGTNDFVWQSRTTATNAWFRGEPGSSYAFCSAARDNVGQEESLPSAPQAFTLVPTNAPVLAGITNFDLMVGQTLDYTNLVSGIPAGSWLFTLGTPVPPGITLNPTNGVLRWTPSCASASATNTITVWVTDTGNTNLADATRFATVVGECVVPSLGRVVLRIGENGRVPIHLISSVPLTNLSLTVQAPAERLTNFWVEPTVPEICTNSLVSLSNSVYWLSLTTRTNQWLLGTQQVAWLHFTAASNQSSAFVSLSLDNITGFQSDGTPVLNFAPQFGRVVIVGQEPLLEALPSASNHVVLLQYALPGSTIALEWTTNLPPAGWQQSTAVLQTNLVQDRALVSPSAPSSFFRAVRQ